MRAREVSITPLVPGELLADTAESGRADLVGLEVHVDAVGEFERQRKVIQDLHGGAHLGAGHADGANGVRVQEPVQHVEIMAILLDNEVARVIAIGRTSCADARSSGRRRGRA